jgi:alpha-ribazole phosphatase
MLELWLWRHPRVAQSAGRCFGQTDLRVDRRRAKRLAHRIRAAARRHQLPRCIWSSPLQRCLVVAHWLRRWGWALHVDARLMEMDFGRWDGLPWSEIATGDIQRWADDLLWHRPGGGECLAEVAARARGFLAAAEAACAAPAAHAAQAGPVARGAAAAKAAAATCLVLTHGGWINALLHVSPQVLAAGVMPAHAWPAAPRHGSLVRWSHAVPKGNMNEPAAPLASRPD